MTVQKITLPILYSPHESEFLVRAVQAAMKAHRDYQLAHSTLTSSPDSTQVAHPDAS